MHPNQRGSLPGDRSFHAAADLTPEVAIAHKLKLKSSTLFLDIEGDLDNVKPAALTGRLRERGAFPLHHFMDYVFPDRKI